MKKLMKKIIGSALIILVITAGAFYAGMVYAKKSQSQQSGSASGTRFQRSGTMGAGGVGMRNGAQGEFVTGEILSKDATGLTVKLRDGGSSIIFVSGSTKITKQVDGTLADLTVGQQVTLTGDKNSDGSIAAQSIQLRPAQMVPIQKSQK